MELVVEVVGGFCVGWMEDVLKDHNFHVPALYGGGGGDDDNGGDDGGPASDEHQENKSPSREREREREKERKSAQETTEEELGSAACAHGVACVQVGSECD